MPRKRKKPKPRGAPEDSAPKRESSRAKQKAAFSRGRQPTPIQAVERGRQNHVKWLKRRNDEFSRTLARDMGTRREKGMLISRIAGSTSERRRLVELAPAAAVGVSNELHALSDRISDLFDRADPLFLLCWTSFWNTVGFDDYYEPTHTGLESKVEYAAGLAVRRPRRTDGPHDPAAAQELLALTDEAFQLAWLLIVAETLDTADPVQAELRYRSRAYSLYVRGDAYVEHASELAHRLFDPEAEWMRHELGFDITDALSIQRSVTELIGSRISALLGDIAVAVRDARDELSQRDLPEAARKAMNRMGKRQLLESYFIGTLAENLVDAMTFASNEIAACARLPSDVVEAFLLALTASSDGRYATPLQRSPLIDGPVIRSEERFLVPVLGLLHRDIAETLSGRVIVKRPKFAKRRATLLDEISVEQLASALPGAQTATSVFYPLEKENAWAECDGLVLWNDICFVLEGKAKPLSPQSRRGDTRRIQADLEASLLEAWAQGNRVVRYISGRQRAPFFDASGREIIAIESGALSYLKEIVPTLYALADHALSLERHPPVGETSELPPWAVYVNDLRVVCDVVRNPAELVCYLRWRDRLGLGVRAFAVDELDVLGAFLLRTGYPDVDGLVQLGSHSTDLDAYYMGSARENGGEKPSMFSTALVDTFTDDLVARRPSGWLTAADGVLGLSLEQLAFLDSGALALARRANSLGRQTIEQMFGLTLVGLAPGTEVAIGVEPPFVAVGLDASGGPCIHWAARHD